jgi:hypothetical protein
VAEKSKLAVVCQAAASGNPAEVKKASQQVCVQIVKDTVPASAQTQALTACKAIG